MGLFSVIGMGLLLMFAISLLILISTVMVTEKIMEISLEEADLVSRVEVLNEVEGFVYNTKVQEMLGQPLKIDGARKFHCDKELMEMMGSIQRVSVGFGVHRTSGVV
jgi:hypothetical protein